MTISRPVGQVDARVFRFAGFTLDPGEHRLLRGADEVPLRPKAFATLAYLALNHSRLVEKAALVDAVWPDVHVTENTLTHCLAEIRAALGDDAEHPRFVRTVARVGYRFIADVEEAAPALQTGAPRLPPAPATGAGRLARRFRWSLVAALAAAAAATLVELRPRRGPRADAAPIRSLAVLPFENLTKDPAQDYFVDGIHEALITDLARLGPARVISRTSVVRYRGTRKPARQMARELGVDGLVEGSVLRVGDRVRVTAQLVRGETDEHVWAGSYDRDVRDVLTLLAEVSGAVAAEVRAAVAAGTAAAPATGSSVPRRSLNPEAYEAYLRGRHAFHALTPEGLEAAAALHRRAVELDPGFAPAWSALAGTRAAQVFFGYASAAAVLPEARGAAWRGLALDENLGEAHGVVGFIALYWDWDHAAAGRALERAVALSPTNTMVRHEYADYLLVTGRAQESLEQTRIGRSCDPQWWTAHSVVLYHAIMARRYDDVVLEGRQMLEAFPDHHGAHERIATALWLQGRHEDALAEWKAARGARDPGQEILESAFRKGGPVAAMAARAEWLAARNGRGPQDAYQTAAWFAAAGRSDQAFDWLERSYARREPFLLHVVADPLFDSVRADPRFTALLRRMGIGAGPSGASDP